MANYFCTDSVEEQVDLLTDKVKDLKNSKLDKAAIVQVVGTGTDVVMSQKAVTDKLDQKSNATNLANGTGDVLIKTTDTNQSFKVMTDGRAKVQTAPTENDDVVRKLELDKKLTAPTNPSADSAVTMLADGTVGTKLLSEIGGGGKVYKHHITFDVTCTNEGYQSIDGIIFIDIYSSSSTAITLNTIPQLESGLNAYIGYLNNPGYGTQGVVGVKFDPTHNEIEVYGAGTSTTEQFQSLYYLFAYNDVTRFVDDYTEI